MDGFLKGARIGSKILGTFYRINDLRTAWICTKILQEKPEHSQILGGLTLLEEKTLGRSIKFPETSWRFLKFLPYQRKGDTYQNAVLHVGGISKSNI